MIYGLVVVFTNVRNGCWATKEAINRKQLQFKTKKYGKLRLTRRKPNKTASCNLISWLTAHIVIQLRAFSKS